LIAVHTTTGKREFFILPREVALTTIASIPGSHAKNRTPYVTRVNKGLARWRDNFRLDLDPQVERIAA
jgi:hypothetical protein